jgi:signal transduction histidine kinase
MNARATTTFWCTGAAPGLREERAHELIAAITANRRYRDRMRAERIIASETAELLGAVLNAAPDPVALVDEHGRILLESRPMRELRSEAGSTEALGLLIGVESERGIDGADPPDEGTTPTELHLPTGQRVFSRRTAPVTNSDGDLLGHLVVLREITRERETERLREDLFGLVSHELRTPLTSIIGYLDLVLEPDGGLSEERRQFLEVVDRNARRLLRLVEDLLFTAQAEAGRLPVELESGHVELRDVLSEAVEAARPRARTRGIDLERTHDDGGPAICRGDRDRLGQVVDNLIANALKFTPEGGRVTARLTTSATEATIEVSDSGPGVPADEHARLFERFYRSPHAIDQAVPGLGLGLSIVKSIVEAHGGRIGVRSHRSGGATFELALPLAGADAAQLAGPPP